jgi:hypothetical protein
MNDGAIPFTQKVRGSGLVEHYILLGEGNMRRWDWEKMSAKLQGDTLAIWRFLLLGAKIPEAEAEKLLGKQAVGFLTRHKLLQNVKGEVSLGAACLLTYRDHLFFADMGSQARTLFSDETRALISMLPRMKKGNCLCMYPTTGVEVLPLISNSDVEVSFLDEEKKRPLLEANLELGALGKKHSFISKAKAVKSSFDLIMSSPPSCISIPGIPLPNFVAGGPDGWKWVNETLRIAEKSLAPDGTVVMVFMFFGAAESAGMEKQIRAKLEPYDLDYRLMIPSKMLMEPGVPIFNQLVALSGHFSKAKNAESIIGKVLTYLKKQQYGAVYLVKGVFSRTQGATRREEVTNYSDDYYGTWTF